jgi:hypothetical protein
MPLGSAAPSGAAGPASEAMNASWSLSSSPLTGSGVVCGREKVPSGLRTANGIAWQGSSGGLSV